MPKTYLDAIRGDIASMRRVARIRPFAAVLGVSAVVEALTLDVFHIDAERNYRLPDRRDRLRFSDWINELQDERLIGSRLADSLRELVRNGNSCRHNGMKPDLKVALDQVELADRIMEEFLELAYQRTCPGCGESRLVVVSLYLRGTRASKAHCRPPCGASLQIHQPGSLRYYRLETGVPIDPDGRLLHRWGCPSLPTPLRKKHLAASVSGSVAAYDRCSDCWSSD